MSSGGMAIARKGISLFASAGIGELGLDAAEVEIVVANELRVDRCGLYRENHPRTTLVEGDIWEAREEILSRCREQTAAAKNYSWPTRRRRARACRRTGPESSRLRLLPAEDRR